MSAFSRAFSRGLDRLYAKLGETATITRQDGFKLDCLVIPNRSLETYGDIGELTGDSVVFSVRRSQVEARLKRGDSVEMTDSCEAYIVDRMITSTEHEHTFIAA